METWQRQRQPFNQDPVSCLYPVVNHKDGDQYQLTALHAVTVVIPAVRFRFHMGITLNKC